MAQIDIAHVMKWLDSADLIFQHPLIKLAVLPLLRSVLPDIGVSPEQMKQLDEHYADLESREHRARIRATGQIPPATP
jgi:hypothetical protein